MHCDYSWYMPTIYEMIDDDAVSAVQWRLQGSGSPNYVKYSNHLNDPKIEISYNYKGNPYRLGEEI